MRKSTKKRATSTKGSAARKGRVLRKPVLRKIVKRTIHNMAETKFQVMYAVTSTTWSGAIASMTDIAQGDTDQTRDGDRIELSSLEYRWVCTPANLTDVVRLIVFQWKGNSTPAVTDVIESTLTASQSAPLSEPSHDNRQLYNILADDLLCGSSTNNTAVCGYTRILAFPGRSVQFSAGGTTGTGKIYYLLIGSAAASSQFTMVYKINYKDA